MTLLDPQSDRTLYTEALTTPPGFRFDCGVGLTYSLGLDTLLAVPLHLLLYSDGRAQKTLLKDRLRVFDGVRKTAHNLSIFHQQGRILAPRGRRVLYSLLEDSVFKASAPRGGIFHPKIWLLRFSPRSDESTPDRGEDPPLIRLSVLSRNLTADRSWDVSLTVEGRRGSDKVEGNDGLVRLFRRLPQLSSPELPKERSKQIVLLAHDLARTAWELPDGIDELRLHTIGLDAGWLPPRSERLVVMSPFCTRGALDRLAERSKSPRALISQPEELSRVTRMSQDANMPFERLLVLGETVETDDDEDASVRRGAHAGLHAKLYLCDEPGLTRLFVGSANSTYSATVGGTNVEVLAELVGSRERLGSVDELLSEDGLGALLEDFDPDDVTPPDPLEVEEQELLERACGTVSDSDFHLSCRPADDGDGDQSWHMDLRADVSIELPPGLRMTAWPITLPRRRGLDCSPLLCGEEITFGPMAVSSITRFIAFEISLKKENPNTPSQAFVLRVPTDALPVQERDTAISREVMSNRDGFLRYLLFLLGAFDGSGAGGGGAWSPGTGGGGGFETLPLLEEMTRAFCRDPSRLDSVRRLVEHLQKSRSTEDNAELVPADFLQLWSTFESALPGGDRE